MRSSLRLVVVFSCIFLASVTIAVLILSIILTLKQANGINVRYLYEIFSRVTLVVFFIPLAIFLFRPMQIQKYNQFSLRADIMLLVYGVGVFASLLDPFHPIRAEGNWIRYFTSSVLSTAGSLLIYTALALPRHRFYRLVSGCLGMLLLAAAVDEIAQFHESTTISVDNPVFQVTQISGQDLITLVAAATAILLALIASKIVRVFERYDIFETGTREVYMTQIILVAGISFLTAMLLDTFDTSITKFVHLIFSVFMVDSYELLSVGLIDGYVETLANSIEEFLEFSSAVLLLSSAIVFSGSQKLSKD